MDALLNAGSSQCHCLHTVGHSSPAVPETAVTERAGSVPLLILQRVHFGSALVALVKYLNCVYPMFEVFHLYLSIQL